MPSRKRSGSWQGLPRLVPQITKKPPAKASGKAGTPNGTANGTPDGPADGTPDKAPADGEAPSNGPVTLNGDAANGGKPLPGVRTLLEFVAWVVFTHQVGSGWPCTWH
jgi:hypothetical protein